MQRSTLKTRPHPTIHAPRKTAFFLLTPSREMPELAPEWDEEEDLTNVIYYSPTAD